MEQTSCDILEYDGELADGGGILDPLVEFVVVDVVVFVCPSLLFVVVLVLSYPPVIFVLLPEEFVCVFVSSANTGLAHIETKIKTINTVIICNQNFIHPPGLCVK
tara:strand:- start:230 stop:544 length:315 start_codon:yes stop_codon:yes gene_type:complete